MRLTPSLLTCALPLLIAIGCGDEAPPKPATDDVCESDLDCDDGLWCNGAESCSPDGDRADDNGCVQGEAVACEGMAECSEAGEQCVRPWCDDDGDGFEDAGEDCGGDDCDDEDPNRFPGNREVCIDPGTGEPNPDWADHDEDCDTSTLGDDADGDTHYDDRCANEQSDGTMKSGTDCDDENDLKRPGFPEICDGIDNNCDGDLNFPGEDLDGDGHESCVELEGAVKQDCDDNDDEIFPGAPELCDGKDNDCDGELGLTEDVDRDGFPGCAGTEALPTYDCNDNEVRIHPGAKVGSSWPGNMQRELCTVDVDCDGFVEQDTDRDGASECSTFSNDGWGVSADFTGSVYASGQVVTLTSPPLTTSGPRACAAGTFSASTLESTQVGWNLSQTVGGDPQKVKLTGTGISVTVESFESTQAPVLSLVANPQNFQENWCAVISASGTSNIPWSQFGAECNTWDPPGGLNPANVEFQIISLDVTNSNGLGGYAAGPFKYCVLDIATY